MTAMYFFAAPTWHIRKNTRLFVALFAAVVLFFAGWPFVAHVVRAADGSGTATDNPTSVNAGSIGNTITFTYTAAESMNSGEVSLAAPSSWSAPQGIAGTAGFVTATSPGTIATVLDNANSASGWSAGTACTGGLALDTSVKQEGTGAIRCTNGNESDGDRWYKTVSPQNWTGYTKVGFWIRTSAALGNANEIRFAYDDNTDLSSPIEQVVLSQTLAANTWTYIVLNLGATTRTSVASFGFYIRHNGNIDNDTVWIDDLLIGPGVPSFPGGGIISTRLLELGVGQVVTLTYGAGGGASGATAPISGESSIFTTRTRVSDAGTLTAIASSPIVTVFNPAPTTTDIMPITRSGGSGAFTVTVNGTNFVPTSVVQINGVNRATTYNSATQLTASLLAGDTASPGSSSITVFNSTPGGGTSNAQSLTVAADVTAPSAITTLALSGATTSSMLLTWTAPGDDDAVGTASLYDIRYATSPIETLADFTDAALVSGEPAPSVAGTVQTMTVTGLSANTLYYFAMKTRDEAPNVSDVSNVPALATAANPDTAPPAAITTLALSGATTSTMQLTWTAPGDDVSVGTASLYDVRYSTAPIVSIADFTAAAEVNGEPAPSVAGTAQTMTVTGLSANTLYYFSVRTQDEVPNISPVSNVPSLTTAANPDITAPSAITTLALSGATTSSLQLTWTAPGDDSSAGTASLYDIRYSTAPISTDADFSTASLVSGEPAPSVAGTVQAMIVTGLSANTVHYFAMKSEDEVPNISPVSNVASLATTASPDTIAPSAITTLALSGATTSSIVLTWTAPGDDSNVGTASLYHIRYATSPIVTVADYTAAAVVSGEPTPAPAGAVQTRTVTGLSANTLYYFAIKSQDEVPNISLLSNTPSLSTAAALDFVAPAAITNLSLQGTSTSEIAVAWTAPGDDGSVGTATLYDIRYSTAPIVNEADFTAASQVSGEPPPGPQGGLQGMTVTGLSANTTYFFAMKTQDEVPNISLISNLPSRATATNPDAAAPSAVTDLTLSGAGLSSMLLNWTAPGDDGSVGTASVYDIRYATTPIVTETDFTIASHVSGEPAPLVAGSPQSMVVESLSSGTTFYFAMKTHDEAPNTSIISNVPSLTTVSSGSGGGGVTDITPPTAVTDLATSGATTSSVVLTWTAPGDDNYSGYASLYDIRYWTSPIITPADFSIASLVSTEPFPAVVGTVQSMTIGGLAAGTTYYFAMKTRDEVFNVSGVSNVASLATVAVSSGGGGGGGGAGGGSTSDMTPPVISSISAASITKNSVILTWRTDEPSDSLARFGTVIPLNGTAFDGAMATLHALPIVGLTSGTAYRHTVCSKDFSGNQRCVGDLNFMTLAATAFMPAYSAAEALATSPTISVDKSLAVSSGAAAACVSGTLIKQPSDGDSATQADSAVYYCGADGKRYAFPDAGTYHSWYPDFSGVRVVSIAELAAVPFGGSVTYRPGARMIKLQTDPKVYAVAKDGVLRWVTSEEVARTLYGVLWSDLISDVSDAFFTLYTIGTPLFLADVTPVVPVTTPGSPVSAACTTTTTFTEFLSSGSSDQQVLPLQKLLQCLGYFPADVAPNGYFGPATEKAVRGFQAANGIDAFGYVGPATRDLFNRYMVK